MLKRLASYSAGLYLMALLTGLARIGLRSLIAKTAGKEALGAYAFYGTAIALGGALVAFGLKRSVAKVVAAGTGERDTAPIVCAVMAGFAAITLAAAAAGVLLSPWLDWVYVFALIALGPVTIFELARAAFRGQLDQRHEIGLLFAGICVQTLCVAGATVSSGSPRAPVWGATAANLLIALAVVAYFVGRHRAAWAPAALGASFRSPAFRGLLALSLPIWISDVLGVVGHQADQVIVQGALGYAALAEYAAAFTFIGLLDQPMTILSRVALVTFAGGHYTEADRYRTVTSLSLAFFSLLGLATMAAAIPLTPVVFTAAYAAVPTLVAILSLSSIFNAVEVLNSSLTIARDYPEANRNAALWSTALYIPLAFLLVHRGGVVGAAWSYVVSWGGYALLHALYMRRRLPEHGALAIRTMLLGTLLYGLAAAAIRLSNSAWSFAAVAPAYFLAGQVAGVWDLRQMPRLAKSLFGGESPAGP